MRIISAIFFVFLSFSSSAQLKESIISQLFTTTRPHGMHTDFKVQICRGGGILSTQPRNFSKLHQPVYKKEEPKPEPRNVCGGGWPISTASENKSELINVVKITDTIVIINCRGKYKEVDKVAKATLWKTADFTTALTGKVGGLSLEKKDSGVFASRRFSCNGQRQLSGHSDPLLVLNSVPVELSQLSNINPNDIQSVEILKSAPATAIFGPDGANGAILVSLKSNYREFVVIDSIDNSPVARATAGIIMKNGDNTMWYVADDKGVFASNSPNEFSDLRMTISAVGYETATRYFNGDISKTDTIRLKRSIKTFDPVIVSATQCWKKIVCYGYARVIKGKVEKAITGASSSFRIYPNPLPRSGSFTVAFNSTGVKAIRILTPDGKELLQQPVERKNILQVQIDPRWPAGIYFVQLVYENERVAASGKIIIQ